jgi:hypothetical protein
MKHKPGRYSLTWNRTDDRGKKLSEGVYFIRLTSPNCEKTRWSSPVSVDS